MVELLVSFAVEWRLSASYFLARVLAQACTRRLLPLPVEYSNILGILSTNRVG